MFIYVYMRSCLYLFYNIQILYRYYRIKYYRCIYYTILMISIYIYCVYRYIIYYIHYHILSIFYIIIYKLYIIYVIYYILCYIYCISYVIYIYYTIRKADPRLQSLGRFYSLQLDCQGSNYMITFGNLITFYRPLGSLILLYHLTFRQ